MQNDLLGHQKEEHQKMKLQRLILQKIMAFGPLQQQIYHQMALQQQIYTTRENPSSSARFEASRSAGGRATNKALQLTYSSSAGATRATTTSFSSRVGKNPRYYYQRGFF